MTDSTPPQLKWSGTFAVDRSSPTPTGDKIILPSSALQKLLDANAAAASASAASAYSYSTPVVTRYTSPYNSFGTAAQPEQQKLPYPLMFRLFNERNGRFVHAGVREFSAEEGQVTLSRFLLRSLGLAEQDVGPASNDEVEDDNKKLEYVKISAHQLPKGTYVALAPIHDYTSYDPAILEPLLERELRQGYTTLSTGTILQVKRGPTEDYQFRVERVKPEGDGICVIDTDLELDLLRVPTATTQDADSGIDGANGAESADKSSPGGEITIWKSVEGKVRHGDYIDYDLPSWDKSRGLVIDVKPLSDDPGFFLDVFVSPKTPHLRQRPREKQHWTARMGPYTYREPVRLEIPPDSLGNDNADDLESLMISIYGFNDETAPGAGAMKFSLRVDVWDATEINRTSTPFGDEAIPGDVADMQKCKDCGQWIPKQSFTMHSLRCARNPKCAQCGLVASRDELGEHWHCDGCSSYGDRLFAQRKHESRMHPSCLLGCSCSASLEFDSVPAMSRHRVTDCPDKIILCRFCHLEVPQEGDPTDPSDVAQAVYTGLTAHERADGARTADCDLCGAIVRLRDMVSHLKHHEMDKKGRAAPPGCRNSICGRTLHGVGPRGTVGPAAGSPNNDLGLCKSCYGPLYVSMHDPEGKALRRRVERRYLTQLMTGCGRAWCSNEWCRTGRSNTGKEALGSSAAAALPLVKPLVTPEAMADKNMAMHFCVDEAAQRSLVVAEMLAAEGVWGAEWCVAAVEAEKGDRDRAREWLQNWAPSKYE